MSRTSALALAVALLCAAPAAAHRGNPNFLTEVDRVTPSTPGITIEVINRDDQLELRNESGEDVVIEGYDDEPYARLDADGAVFVNEDSPAYYLNEERFANVEVPDDVEASDAPAWKKLDESGRFAWHDHRMHWMGKNRPPQVKDADKRQTVLTWDVPITVGGAEGAIAGTLFWTPDPDTPTGFIIVGTALVVILCAAALVIRRRRDRAEETSSEAW